MAKAAVTSCLLLLAAAATAQTGQTERVLPQWLTGITAVAIFLFLAFVTFLVNKAWCGSPSSGTSAVDSERETQPVMTVGRTRDSAPDESRSKGSENAYDNLVFDSAEEKVTAM